MSYPILYEPNETAFNHNGCGILGDCASCLVTEEANGAFELSMQYPMDGIHFEDIQSRSIIKAKPDQFRNPQLFRVYNISKPNMNGIVNIFAQHISYDLSGIPVSPFTADGVALALAGLKSHAVVYCPFEFWTDKDTAGKFTVPHPASIRSRLGGVQGSIIDNYGGEYEFDNFTVKLHNNRGMDRGVSIRYGKNLVSLKQEENCQNIATGVYPYWANPETGAVVQLPGKIVNADDEYSFTKIRTVDFTSYFETEPTIDQLRSVTANYISNNEIGVPVVSLDVSFAQLQKSEEYKHLQLLERVSLFDTLSVEFPDLKVSARAKAVKIVYNVLLDRVESVTLGSVRANIADTIVEQKKEIEKKPSLSLVQAISHSLSKAIMGANGGAVRLIDTNDDGEPDELYIADNADPTQAVKVWRFNYNGWAASQNGYSGPFEFGATLADGLLANFVTAAQLVAGTIKSKDDGKTFFLDLDNGTLNMNATQLTISGKAVDKIAEDKAADAVNNQTQSDIFNKLTNNGVLQGLYMQDGQLYINASYLKSGTLDANIINVINLIAEKLSSTNEESEVRIDGAVFEMLYDGKTTAEIHNDYGQTAQIYIYGYGDSGERIGAGAINYHQLELGGSGVEDRLYIGVQDETLKPYIILPGGELMFISFKDNGDGTYTLIGQ